MDANTPPVTGAPNNQPAPKPENLPTINPSVPAPKPEAEKTSLPTPFASSTPPPASSATDLFSNSLFAPKKQSSTAPSGIAESIIKLASEEKNHKNILGDAPILDESIIDRTFIQKRQLNILYSVLGVLGLLFLLSFGFFYSQLTKDFNFLGSNIAQKVETSNQEIYRLQTDTNLATNLTSQMLLNRFALEGNKYQDLHSVIISAATSEEQKASAQSQLPELEQQLFTILGEMQKVFSRPTFASVFVEGESDQNSLQVDFNNRTRARMVEEARRFQSIPEQRSEFTLYQTAVRLISNNVLRGLITSADIPSLQTSPAQLAKLITQVAENARNEFSIVNSLKAQRIDWNDVLTNIINATKQAEEGLIVANEGPYQMQLYESGGVTSILYSNYTIDAQTDKISIAGNLKTPNEKTFSTMANLIESFESSAKFRGVNYRAFSKSGSVDKGFESNFRLEFYLQENTPPPAEDSNTTPVNQ